MLRSGACLTVVLILSLAACGRGSAPSSTPAETSKASDLDELRREASKRVASHLTIEAEGDVSVRYDANTDLRIVVFDPGERFESAPTLVSVGLEGFVKLSAGPRIRAYVDLVGFGVKAGTYEIPKVGSSGGQPAVTAGATPGPAAARALSTAYLSYLELEEGATGTPAAGDVRRAREFNRVLEPCTLELGAKARSGSLDCPKLSDSGDHVIHFEMSWRPR